MRNASHSSGFQERDLITTNTATMMHPQRVSWWELCEHATTTRSNESQTLALISSPSASPHQGIAGFLPLQHSPKPHTPADDSGEHSGTSGGATQHPTIIRSRHTTPENAQPPHANPYSPGFRPCITPTTARTRAAHGSERST